ncbi:hypothetical protein AB0L40_18980 [Patulibacter sp. NPDC049589]|uniref:hypothetical protein n=1 Tax=Patulibacter sp. NPDC049589 TaxID=3154731 RepID=UPI003417A31B
MPLAIAAARDALPCESAGPENALLGATTAARLGGLLLALAEGPDRSWASAATLGTLVATIAVPAAWVASEVRTASPLVDVRLLRHPSVLAADVMVLPVGIGIFSLLSLVVRCVQTPEAACYGFDSSVAVAGLMLEPYSAADFGASRVVRRLAARFTHEVIVAAASGVLIASMVLFLLARSSIVRLLVTMALAGFGVGAIFAMQPAQLYRGVPEA